MYPEVLPLQADILLLWVPESFSRQELERGLAAHNHSFATKKNLLLTTKIIEVILVQNEMKYSRIFGCDHLS